MLRAVRAFLSFGLCLSAACSTAGPPWSQLEAGTKGEDTLTGAPAPVPATGSAPTIDGVLDDAAWTHAARLGPLVDPGGGTDAPKHPVATLARLTWDATHLYLGIVVRDKAPTSPFGRDDDDPHIWGAASGVELMLQPGDPGDNKDYYELQVDVNGAVFDTHFDDYNMPISGNGNDKRFGHQDWRSQVRRAVSVQQGAFYSVEIALPWAALAPARTAIPPKPGDVWRLNLYSFRDGQRRALAWSPLRGRGNFHRSERFGRVRFVD